MIKASRFIKKIDEGERKATQKKRLAAKIKRKTPVINVQLQFLETQSEISKPGNVTVEHVQEDMTTNITTSMHGQQNQSFGLQNCSPTDELLQISCAPDGAANNDVPINYLPNYYQPCCYSNPPDYLQNGCISAEDASETIPMQAITDTLISAAVKANSFNQSEYLAATAVPAVINASASWSNNQNNSCYSSPSFHQLFSQYSTQHVNNSSKQSSSHNQLSQQEQISDHCQSADDCKILYKDPSKNQPYTYCSDNYVQVYLQNVQTPVQNQQIGVKQEAQSISTAALDTYKHIYDNRSSAINQDKDNQYYQVYMNSCKDINTNYKFSLHSLTQMERQGGESQQSSCMKLGDNEKNEMELLDQCTGGQVDQEIKKNITYSCFHNNNSLNSQQEEQCPSGQIHSKSSSISSTVSSAMNTQHQVQTQFKDDIKALQSLEESLQQLPIQDLHEQTQQKRQQNEQQLQKRESNSIIPLGFYSISAMTDPKEYKNTTIIDPSMKYFQCSSYHPHPESLTDINDNYKSNDNNCYNSNISAPSFGIIPKDNNNNTALPEKQSKQQGQVLKEIVNDGFHGNNKNAFSLSLAGYADQILNIHTMQTPSRLLLPLQTKEQISQQQPQIQSQNIGAAENEHHALTYQAATLYVKQQRHHQKHLKLGLSLLKLKEIVDDSPSVSPIFQQPQRKTSFSRERQIANGNQEQLDPISKYPTSNRMENLTTSDCSAVKTNYNRAMYHCTAYYPQFIKRFRTPALTETNSQLRKRKLSLNDSSHLKRELLTQTRLRTAESPNYYRSFHVTPKSYSTQSKSNTHCQTIPPKDDLFTTSAGNKSPNLHINRHKTIIFSSPSPSRNLAYSSIFKGSPILQEKNTISNTAQSSKQYISNCQQNYHCQEEQGLHANKFASRKGSEQPPFCIGNNLKTQEFFQMKSKRNEVFGEQQNQMKDKPQHKQQSPSRNSQASHLMQKFKCLHEAFQISSRSCSKKVCSGKQNNQPDKENHCVL